MTCRRIPKFPSTSGCGTSCTPTRACLLHQPKRESLRFATPKVNTPSFSSQRWTIITTRRSHATRWKLVATWIQKATASQRRSAPICGELLTGNIWTVIAVILTPMGAACGLTAQISSKFVTTTVDWKHYSDMCPFLVYNRNYKPAEFVNFDLYGTVLSNTHSILKQ